MCYPGCREKKNFFAMQENTMRLNHVSAIAFSGLIWLLAGFFLLRKGLHLILMTSLPDGDGGLLTYLAQIAGNKEQAGLLLILVGLFLGYIKGKTVLAKTVKRVVERIFSLPSPVKFSQLYTSRYYVLIAIMVGLGLLLRWVHLAEDIRGVIDVAIGSALLKGAILYFRSALAARKQRSIEN
jgi:hypothetical protein